MRSNASQSLFVLIDGCQVNAGNAAAKYIACSHVLLAISTTVPSLEALFEVRPGSIPVAGHRK
jgi:hypothetical protein